MQSHDGGYSHRAEAPIMLPCCICGTYSKGIGNKRFFRYVEPKLMEAKGSGTETEDAAGSSAAPADSESSLDFGSSSDSDVGRGSPPELRDDGHVYGMGSTPSQRGDAAGSLVDSQATVLLSQPQSVPSSVRKRAAVALQPRAICSRCRLHPRPASSAHEDLVGRHSSWGNVSPFYFDLDAASAALAHAPALQQLPPEIALSAGLVVRTPGRPQQTSITSRIMACALAQSMANANPTRPSFKTFLVRRLTFAAWSALTHCDWESAEALARALQPARMVIADVLWKTGLEVLRRNPAKDSQRRRFAQMCIGFTQGPLNTAVLNQHVIDTVQYSADADAALAELRRFTVGSTIAASPVLHYAIACAGLAVAATAAAEGDGNESQRVAAAHRTALDAAVRLLEVAPEAAQSHVTMWHTLNSCGRSAEAAAVVEAALAATSPLHMHPSLLHIAVSDPAVSCAVATSSALCLMQLDPCHPAPAACIAAAAAAGRLKLPAAAEALAAALDTQTPLDARTWEIVTLSLGQLMWGWDMERVQDWLGWRFVWWRRLHLLNVQRQISKAVSREAQSIIACKALLAPLLEGPDSSFRMEFARSCSAWAAAVWLQQAELLCSETGSLSAQESPQASEGGRGGHTDACSSAAAASESSSAAVSSTMSVSMQ